MTNQPTEHSRSGHAPRLRGSGAGRSARALLALVGLLAMTTSMAVLEATAAEVVEVRVGRHPDFTRVVFELDRAAGYRIERSDPSSKNAELIVSLEAGSIPRRIQSSKSFIEQVVVEPSGGRSIARIRLAQGGLKLKEMILASPPRIVLDVIAEGNGTATPTGTASTASTTKIASTPSKTALSSSTPATAPTTAKTPTAPQAPPSVPTPPAPAVAKTAAPTPAPIARPNPTATANVPDKPSAAPAPETKLLASTEKSGTGASDSGSGIELAANDADDAAVGGAGSEAAGSIDDSNGPDADDGTAGGEDADVLAAAQPAADPTPAAAGEAAAGRPMVVKSTSRGEDGEGGGLMTWGLAAVGLGLAAFGGLVVARRRRAAASEGDEYEAVAGGPFADADAEAATDETEEEAAEAPRSSRAETSNPFAGLASGATALGKGILQGRETSAGSESFAGAPKAARGATTQEHKPSESLLFDDAEEKTMEGMEVISRSQANESLGGSVPMMGGASDELTQMFREMQRRVAALETRIDELVDARDRLERQVAAQTEELRVQRAAIARTQRAVRNLARPEDCGDDEPTEPALREPN
jgi:hypothetical protein